MTWLPFELHPDTPPETVLLRDYFKHLSPAQLGQMHANLKARADQLGLPMSPPPVLANTRRALALAEYARDQGKLDHLHRPLFQAYFVLGQNLYDEAVLRGVAQQAGLDPEQAMAAVLDGRYEERLDQAAAQARAYGISGVPTFIINRKYKVVGAHPYESLRDAIRQIAREA